MPFKHDENKLSNYDAAKRDGLVFSKWRFGLIFTTSSPKGTSDVEYFIRSSPVIAIVLLPLI